jgi:hypothetical protein
MTELQRIAVRGTFEGHYEGTLDGTNASLGNTYYVVNFTRASVREGTRIPGYDRRHLTYEPYYEVPILRNVEVRMQGVEDDVVFVEDLHDVVLNDLVIEHLQAYGAHSYGIFRGTLYGTLLRPRTVPDPPVPVRKPVVRRVAPTAVPVVSTPIPEPTPTPVPDPPKPPAFVGQWQQQGAGTASFLGWTGLLMGLLALLLGASPLLWLLLFLLALNAVLRITAALGWSNSATAPSAAQRNLFLILFIALCLYLGWYWLAGFFGLALLFQGSGAGFNPFRWLGRAFLGLLAVAALIIGAQFLLRGGAGGGGAAPTPVDVTPRTDTTGGVTGFTYRLRWNDLDDRSYSGTLRVDQDTFRLSHDHRMAINAADLPGVYASVTRHDAPLVRAMVHLFDSLQAAERPDRRRFASMMVTCVQHIPYVLVHEGSCAELLRENSGDRFLVNYHNEGRECLSGCRFGLQAPAEFSFNLKGDCDTRAVLLHTLLTHYGYASCVLVSPVYGHAILGIAGPEFGGRGVRYQGRVYRAWETTSTGWDAGQLPPDIADMDNWQVATTP